ncbi:MAG: hypothetical protein K0Q99_1883, partial [Clostridia bacterium]|nr:hypothetical protein [Clostridia bacterium]
LPGVHPNKEPANKNINKKPITLFILSPPVSLLYIFDVKVFILVAWFHIILSTSEQFHSKGLVI